MDFSSSLFAVVGQPRNIALQNLCILIFSLILLYPLTLCGISGTALAMTVPVLTVAGVSLRQSAKTLQARLMDFDRRLQGPLAAAGALGGLGLGLRAALYAVLPSRVAIPLLNVCVSVVTIVMLVGIFSGIAVYFAILCYVDRKVYQGVKRRVGLVIGGLPYLSQ